MKTEKEIYNELKEPERNLADKYRYTNYLFKVNIKEIINGHDARELGDGETINWIKKIIDEY